MAKKIKGITIEIGGNTSGLTKALESADKALSATKKEINEVEKALKLDPSNVTLLAQKQELLTQAIDETSSKLKALEDNAEKAKKAFEAGKQWDAQFAPLKEKIDAAKASLAELKKKQQEAEKEFAAGKISAEDYDKIKADVKAAEDALKELNGQKKKLDEQFKDGHISAEEYRAYQREVESTRSRLQSLQTELHGTGVSAEESQKKMSEFGSHARESIGGVVKAAAAITAALVAVAKKAAETGAAFDASMSQVAATMGYSVEEINTEGTEAAETFATLRKFAQDMGKSTAFSANEASQALNYMALAGYDAEKAMSMLPKVLDLASAGTIDLAKASDMVTDAQSALGLSIEGTEVLIDQMAKTASRSNTSVEQLGEGILNIGATAKDIKGGTKELTEVLGILADNGIKGSEGGTKLRNILLKLEAPTDKAAAKLKELGVEAYDADGHLRSMQDIFGDLNTALADLDDQSASLAKATIFNARDLGAVNSLLNTSRDRWEQLGEEIENSAGAAHDMAEVQLDNLAGDVTLFKSALEGAEITISDRLTPSLRNMVQFGTDAVGKLADGFGQGGLSGAVAAAHKIIRDSFEEDAGAIFGAEAAVQGLITAFVTYKGVSLLTEGIQAMRTLNAAIQTATTSTEALNAATTANPYALIAAIAAGAAMAVKRLIDIETDLIDETDEGYKKLDEAQKAVVDSTNETITAINKSRDTYKKNQKAVEDQAAVYRGLADELYRLDAQQEIDVKDREAMKAIADKLNSSIKGLNIQLDAQTGHLLTQRDTINALIDGYEREAKAAAARGRLTELYAQEVRILESKRESQKKVEEAEEVLNGLIEKRNILQRQYEETLDSAKMQGVAADESAAVQTMTDALEKANKAVQDQRDKVGELSTAYVNAGSSAREVQGEISTVKDIVGEMAAETEKAADETADALGKIEGSANGAAGAVGISFEEMQKEVDSAVSEIEARIKAYEDKLASRTGTLQSWFDVNATVSGDDAKFGSLKKALDKQIDDMRVWSADIEKLEKEGINQNFLDRLKDAGPQSQALVSELLKVPEEERNAYAEKWNTAYENAAKTAERQLSRMKTETENAIGDMIKALEEKSPEFKAIWESLGGDAIDGYIEGLRDGTKLDELKAAVKDMVDAALETTAEEQDSHSPAKKPKKLGKYFGEGYTEGIEDEWSKAVSAAKKMVNAAMSAAGSGDGKKLASLSSPAENVAKDINGAASAAGTVQTVVPKIDTEALAKEIKSGLKEAVAEALKTDKAAGFYVDSEKLADVIYKPVDERIGRDAALTVNGY